MQEAQQLFDEVAGLIEKLPALDRCKVLQARGHFYGQRGEWEKAAADFTKAIESGSDDVYGVWYPLAVLHLRAGRTKEYRTLCEQLLDRFEQRDDVWVGVICKLAPDAMADLTRPVRIAERLIARQPENLEYVGLLGNTLFRKGELRAAVARLEICIHSGPGAKWRKLSLAMAYHRLGRGGEAQQLLREVTEWLDKITQPNAQDEYAILAPHNWAHREELRFLHREAAALIGAKKNGR